MWRTAAHPERDRSGPPFYALETAATNPTVKSSAVLICPLNILLVRMKVGTSEVAVESHLPALKFQFPPSFHLEDCFQGDRRACHLQN